MFGDPGWKPCQPKKHKPVPDTDADNEGGTICSVCSVILSGPLDDEAKAFGKASGLVAKRPRSPPKSRDWRMCHFDTPSGDGCFHKGYCPCYECLRGDGPARPSIAHAVEVVLDWEGSWSRLRDFNAVRLSFLDRIRLDRKARLLARMQRAKASPKDGASRSILERVE